MKSFLKLIIILFLFAGCSGEGKVKIINETEGKLLVEDLTKNFVISSKSTKTESWLLSGFLFGVGERDIVLRINGDYKRYDEYKIQLVDKQTEELTINQDCGRITIYNDSPFAITNIFIVADSIHSDWGDDILPNDDYVPRQSYYAYQSDAGIWDVKIIDSFDGSERFWDIRVENGKTEVIRFSGE